MDSILKTNNLTKKYGEQVSVNNLCMNVCKGDIYGFVGKNGAGKSTTLKMILGLIPATSGSINIFGQDVKKGDVSYLRNIGSIIEFPSSYEDLSAYDNLKMHAGYMGITDKNAIESSLERVGLLNTGDKKVREFSLGMKQRLGIARAILHKPKLLILDEPTNGLDPLGIRDFRNFILRLVEEDDLSVIISSHILSELELIVNKVGIIDKGVLLKEADIKSLRNECAEYADIKVDDIVQAQKVLKEGFSLDSLVTEDEYVRIDLKEKDIQTDHVSRLLVNNDLKLFELIKHNESLEEYFVNISGKEKLW